MESFHNKASEENVRHFLLDVPLNCRPLAHQVAGHFFGKGRTKLGIYFNL